MALSDKHPTTKVPRRKRPGEIEITQTRVIATVVVGGGDRSPVHVALDEIATDIIDGATLGGTYSFPFEDQNVHVTVGSSAVAHES